MARLEEASPHKLKQVYETLIDSEHGKKFQESLKDTYLLALRLTGRYTPKATGETARRWISDSTYNGDSARLENSTKTGKRPKGLKRRATPISYGYSTFVKKEPTNNYLIEKLNQSKKHKGFWTKIQDEVFTDFHERINKRIEELSEEIG